MYAVMYFGICIYGTYRQLKFVNIISSISNGRYSPSRRFQILLQNSPFSVNLKISLHFEKNHNRITRNDQSFMYKQEKKNDTVTVQDSFEFRFPERSSIFWSQKNAFEYQKRRKIDVFLLQFFYFWEKQKNHKLPNLENEADGPT